MRLAEEWRTASGDNVEIVQSVNFLEDELPRCWYWHVRSPNNQIIAASGESFTRKWSAKRAALRSFPPAPVSESIRPYKETS